MNKDLKKYIGIINNHLDDLKDEFGVNRIAIFGSTVKGKHTSKSDIDIFVELKEPIGFFAFIKLENKLSKLLEKKVDLTTKQAIKPIIKKTILKEAVYA